MALSLKDYFLLGDLHSAALVSKTGSIDWLCWPHFDSPSVFAQLLDSKKGGGFAVAMPGWNAEAAYRKNTALVDFVFRKWARSFQMTDFMVPQTAEGDVLHLLVRKFRGATQPTQIALRLCPKPGYGKWRAAFERGHRKLSMKLGKELLILYFPPQTAVKLHDPHEAVLTFRLAPGEEKSLVLEYSKREVPSYEGEDHERAVERFWKTWVKKGHYTPFCRDRLVRSAITLKLMQFYPSGGFIAAPTTSIPEVLGGERNWDYRYVWVRDATFILYGLQLLGHTEEAVRFFQYIERVTKACDAKDIHIRLMYTIAGEPVPEEKELKHLSGYRNSRPVRIGNGAKDQFQLDVYGSMIDAYRFMGRKGILPTPPSKTLMLHLAERIEQRFEIEDNGIWETRGKRHRFTYGRVMAWVGIDRLLQMRQELGLSQDQVRHFQKLEKKIRTWIWSHCFDRRRKAFRQHSSGTIQDAANFLFVLLHFLDKYDPLTKTIIENTARELVHHDAYVYRYKASDGLPGREGAFLLCSFWYIAALAAVGEVETAERLFKKLERCFSESQLLPEELDPQTGEYLGNFPQAFSHIGYIMSAHYLEKAKQKARGGV